MIRRYQDGIAVDVQTIRRRDASGAMVDAEAAYIVENGVKRQVWPTMLAEFSWAQIAKASMDGKASSLWNIGDEKDIVVNGETLTFQIYGFNHDNLTGGGKAGITFGMKHLMTERRQMNSTNTNVGSFTGSSMYDWMQDTLFPSLPADLKAVIKAVDKKTSAGNQSDTINTNSMKLFFFSEIECFGSKTYSVKGEGEAYPIFTNNESRIKKLANGVGSSIHWWERSPYATNSNYFCTVRNDGDTNYTNASSPYGVCFGFCI